jgi:O-antigen/teichoic acid export membrane protein
MMSLRKQTVQGMAHRTLQTFMQRLLNLVTSMVLARLIAPAEFGLLGMVGVFFALAQVIMDSGFGQALIQKHDLTQEDKNAVFFFNMAAGLLFGVGFYFSALIPITRLLGLSYFIGSLGMVQNALLTREMNFRALMIVHMASTVVSSAVGIVLAFRGLGVWALVWSGFAGCIVIQSGLWLSSNWKPTLCFDLSSLRGLFGFSSKMLALSLMGGISRHAYTLVIGKLYPAATLGFFSRARKLNELMYNTVAQPMNTVMFPGFSKLQHDRERLKRSFEQSLDAAMLLYAPLILGAGAVSKALGRPGLRLMAELIVSPLTLLMIAAAAPFGVTAMVWTAVLQGWLWAVVMILFSRRVLDLSVWREIKLIFRTLFLGGVMYALVFFLPLYKAELSIMVILLLKIIVGVVGYGVLMRVFAKPASLQLLASLSGILPPRLLLVLEKMMGK